MRERVLRVNAWDILWTGAHSPDAGKRSKAVEALGLLHASPKGVQLAEAKLQDRTPAVRRAAATALGEMHSTTSIPKLEKLLSDSDMSVALAAARSLLLMHKQIGYEPYFAVLTGKRKSGQGLIAQQLDQFNNPKKLATFVFDQGVGFLPYAGYGLEVIQALKQKDNSPLRAAAAGVLANDPDPRSAEALAQACSDKSWIVRTAALKAVARRGNPALLPDITPAMQDKVDVVRFTAAAAVLRLTCSA
jgi:HEAT repeat protein